MAKKTKFDVTMPIMASVVGLGLFAIFRMSKAKSGNQNPTEPPPQITIPK